MSDFNMFNMNDENRIEEILNELENEEEKASIYYNNLEYEKKADLIEFGLEVINEYYLNNIHLIHEEGFNEFMKTNVLAMLNIQKEVGDNYSKIFDDLEDDMHTLIMDYILNDIEKTFYTHMSPRRSYDKTFIRTKPNVEIMTQKIKHIRDKPQPEQRTEEWYKTRHNMITASSAGDIFSTQSTINRLIYDKCKPFTPMKGSAGGALGWGVKYEPVSVMFYENNYSLKVEDFGCIQHDRYSFIGASPDGIVVSPESYRYGRMLEIKNPISRKINGNPKKGYWIQMQLQMEVCNLNECDFLETKFVEYENEEQFNNDGTFCSTVDGQLKGIILQFKKNEEETLYEYLPIYSTEYEYDVFKNRMINKYGEDNFVRDIYYKLDYYSCVLVLRNKDWVKFAIPEISNIWDIIEKERVNGYEHRAPKKKKIVSQPECLIDVSDMNTTQEGINDMFENKNISVPKVENNPLSIFKIRTESFDESAKSMEEPK